MLYDPEEIRRRSREQVRRLLEPRDLDPPQRDVVHRVVHATGDPALADRMRFTGGVTRGFRQGLREGLPLVTDVTMVRSGLRRAALSKLGVEAVSYVHDEKAARRAKRDGVTRSAAGLDLALERHERFLLVVGNAPTVLFRLLEGDDVQRSRRIPAVIGVPVGFVGVEASKRRLLESAFASLVLEGRRGGSPVAAAAVNALLERERDGGG